MPFRHNQSWVVADARPSVLRRYLVNPVIDQLRQGITSDKIAQTIAVGAACGVFPVLGSTTLLCLIVGSLLRLNQPILQLVNYVVYPAQLALILVFIRIGERLDHAPAIGFSIPELWERFRTAPLRFFEDFATTFLHGITAWLILAPVSAAMIYYAVRPLLHRLAHRFTLAR